MTKTFREISVKYFLRNLIKASAISRAKFMEQYQEKLINAEIQKKKLQKNFREKHLNKKLGKALKKNSEKRKDSP